jgi:hypothetical protein
MEHSTIFIALETMARQGWFWDRLSNLEGLLDSLEKKHLITPAELKVLLQLAKKPSGDDLEKDDLTE